MKRACILWVRRLLCLCEQIHSRANFVPKKMGHQTPGEGNTGSPGRVLCFEPHQEPAELCCWLCADGLKVANIPVMCCIPQVLSKRLPIHHRVKVVLADDCGLVGGSHECHVVATWNSGAHALMHWKPYPFLAEEVAYVCGAQLFQELCHLLNIAKRTENACNGPTQHHCCALDTV